MDSQYKVKYTLYYIEYIVKSNILQFFLLRDCYRLDDPFSTEPEIVTETLAVPPGPVRGE